MKESNKTLKEKVVEQTKRTGILPCIKMNRTESVMEYVNAMYKGGARLVEVTMTTPGALDIIREISNQYGESLYVGAGTVLTAATANDVILHGGSFIVSPALEPEVIQTANKYGIPAYIGAFSATEVLTAMKLGATMIKVFPASLGGPKYMTNLRMVYPRVDLIPSGGVTLSNAAEFIRCGACAVSGARVFMDHEQVSLNGFGWITEQVQKFITIVGDAKKNGCEIP